MNYILSRLILYTAVIWWIQPHYCVHCSIAREEQPKQPNAAHYCVDISADDSICSSDPIVALESVYSRGSLNSFNIGVTQTIDGTEDEQNSIRKVLTQMNHYWYNEVLSNFEYDEARATW